MNEHLHPVRRSSGNVFGYQLVFGDISGFQRRLEDRIETEALPLPLKNLLKKTSDGFVITSSYHWADWGTDKYDFVPRLVVTVNRLPGVNREKKSVEQLEAILRGANDALAGSDFSMKSIACYYLSPSECGDGESHFSGGASEYSAGKAEIQLPCFGTDFHKPAAALWRSFIQFTVKRKRTLESEMKKYQHELAWIKQFQMTNVGYEQTLKDIRT